MSEKENKSAESASTKPAVLSLAIKEKAALYAAYMPYVEGGGLFIPTSKNFKMDEEVFMLLSLIDDPVKLKVVGKVVWVSPTKVNGRPQGIGVQFNAQDGGVEVKNKIETILAGALKSGRATHTL